MGMDVPEEPGMPGLDILPVHAGRELRPILGTEVITELDDLHMAAHRLEEQFQVGQLGVNNAPDQILHKGAATRQIHHEEIPAAQALAGLQNTAPKIGHDGKIGVGRQGLGPGLKGAQARLAEQRDGKGIQIGQCPGLGQWMINGFKIQAASGHTLGGQTIFPDQPAAPLLIRPQIQVSRDFAGRAIGQAPGLPAPWLGFTQAVFQRNDIHAKTR